MDGAEQLIPCQEGLAEILVENLTRRSGNQGVAVLSDQLLQVSTCCCIGLAGVTSSFVASCRDSCLRYQLTTHRNQATLAPARLSRMITCCLHLTRDGRQNVWPGLSTLLIHALQQLFSQFVGLYWSPRILVRLMEVVQLEEDTQFLAETADPLPAWKWMQKVPVSHSARTRCIVPAWDAAPARIQHCLCAVCLRLRATAADWRLKQPVYALVGCKRMHARGGLVHVARKCRCVPCMTAVAERH